MSITVRDDVSTEVIQTWGSDELIARAARVSNNSDKLEGVDPKRLVNALWREGHTTPFEICGATILVEVPIFVARQLVKHRHLSISEVSGRYGVLETNFYMPAHDRPLLNVGSSMNPDMKMGSAQLHAIALNAHIRAYEVAEDSYRSMIASGVANEVARNVLPVGVYTRIYVSANLHAFLKLLDLRGRLASGHPQYEIGKMADGIEEILADAFPYALQAWRDNRR